MPKKKAEETESAVETPVTESAEETAAVEAAPAAEAKTKKEAETKSEVAAATDGATAAKKGKRAERIGVVTSDKMTKTVVVNVDRLVKHPIYRKYVRKRKKFMAHDEIGAKIGDKVRIMETRPMSARKRWRVVEIIQKAEL